MSSADGSFQGASIEATSSFDSDEEALEALVKLKDLKLGDAFTNRETNLDTDENTSIRIQFFHDEMTNYLRLSTQPDSNLNIELTLSDDYIERMPSIVNTILAEVNPIIQERLTIYRCFDFPFESLDLPIKEDPEMDISGIRFRRDDGEYYIQENDEGDLIVIVDRTEEKKIEEEVSDEYVLSDVDAVDSFIRESL